MLNIEFILITLLVFHLDISGNDIDELHFLNIPIIQFILFVFLLNISGNDINRSQQKNISCISFRDSIFYYFSMIFLLTFENENT